MDEYRRGYPNKRNDDPTANDNVLFYSNLISARPNSETVDVIHEEWAGRYEHLEVCHNYIQWLFPIQEPGLNPSAQVLMRHEKAAMCADPEIQTRVLRSFTMMLNFYGMRLADSRRGIVVRAARNAQRYQNLNTSSHNYLRITRILKHLGEMGHEHLKIGWLRFFAHEIICARALTGCASSFRDYWALTIYDDRQRANFFAWCRTLAAADAVTGADTGSSGGGELRHGGSGYSYSYYRMTFDDDDEGTPADPLPDGAVEAMAAFYDRADAFQGLPAAAAAGQPPAALAGGGDALDEEDEDSNAHAPPADDVAVHVASAAADDAAVHATQQPPADDEKNNEDGDM